MRLVRLGLTLSALALGVVSALLSGCSHSQAATAAAAAPPPQVTVAQVIARPLHQWVELTGTLQAINAVQVRPRVSGYVDAVRFTEGARVAKGATLFQIDPRPFQLEADRLGAELNRAQSRLEVASAGKARAERLIAQNAISREEYEQLTSAATEAAGDLGSIRAQLNAARLNLEFTQVRSPIDGHVSRALITAGNLVSSADVLTTVVSDDPIYAYFDTDEATYLQFARLADASAHARGDYASAVFMGLVGEQGYPHAGKLDFLDNQVDAHSGTIRARAVFDNRDGRLTPGLFARIRLVANDSYDAVLIDDRAIGTDLGKKFVLVLKPDSSLDYRQVELGQSVEGLRVVRRGLAAGDVIVVNGLQHVAPGVLVQATHVQMDASNAAMEQVAANPVAVKPDAASPVAAAAATSNPMSVARTLPAKARPPAAR
jgi:multidrug efflux system membrane fusion protein